MANIEEHITTKSEAVKIEQTKNIQKKKFTEEEKRKFIVYGIFGVIILAFIIYALNDFGSDGKEKQVTEMETPVSESDKYNSKLQAIDNGEKKDVVNNNLEDAYKENGTPPTNNENDNLNKQINEYDKNQKQNNIVPTSQRTENYAPQKTYYQNRNTSASANEVYSPYENPEPIIKKPKVTKKSESEDNEFDTNGFFSHSNEKTKTTKNKNESESENTSNSISDKPTDKTIYACIHTDQIIKSENRVKFRLTRTATIDGNTYPMNTIVYGFCKITPNRLNISITNINQNPVKLEVYDAEDSSKGIYILTPNLNASIKKEVGNDALDENTDFDKVPFSKTLKSIFQKKIKEEQVELLNNYKIIIKKKNNNEN